MATEALAQYAELVALPCYRWTHGVVVPPGHELAERSAARPLTLEQLARHPIITYEPGYTGRTHIDEAFAAPRPERSNIVLSAMDADVIKTYVELGMGVGIVASMAFDEARDAAPARPRRAPPVRQQHDARWRCAAAPSCAAMPTTSSAALRRR